MDSEDSFCAPMNGNCDKVKRMYRQGYLAGLKKAEEVVKANTILGGQVQTFLIDKIEAELKGG